MPRNGEAGLEDLPIPLLWSDDGRAVLLLDQTLLPAREEYRRLETVEEVAEAIASLRVRGAPAIGIAAAMGLALGARRRLLSRTEPKSPDEMEEMEAGFVQDLQFLRRTRPTAVNLGWALERMASVFSSGKERSLEDRVDALTRESDAMAREDREMGRLIGRYGAQLIPESGAGILTHCNAGALATGGVGTALAPVYEAHRRGIDVRLFADETRPLLQGSRLTAWEARYVGVPVTVLTDSMAAYLMARGDVNLVIVGADRIAANGDVANKIGTYGLAISASHHGIPFYVAAPRSTFDPDTPVGAAIPIEEREAREVGAPEGPFPVPRGVSIWNPAFDVTPSHLVTAFVTDGGVLRPPYEPAIARLLRREGPPESLDVIPDREDTP